MAVYFFMLQLGLKNSNTNAWDFPVMVVLFLLLLKGHVRRMDSYLIIFIYFALTHF